MEYLIAYIMVSLVLCEGLIMNGKNTGKGTKLGEYIVLFLLGPLAIILLVLKGRK